MTVVHGSTRHQLFKEVTMQLSRIKKLFSCVAGLFAVAAISTLSPAAGADVAVSFDPGSGSVLSGGFTLGWTFTPTSNITVTDIGWWDHNLDGLVEDHDVAFWEDGTMTLMGGGTVDGTATLDGEFMYVSLGVPINLLAGTTYVIGGSNDLEDYTYSVTGLTTGADITYGQNRYEFGSSLTYPSLTFGPSEPGYFGPNFKYSLTGAAVPEPGTYAMGAGMGLAALLSFRRKRARK
jgi:hypothetical protein